MSENTATPAPDGDGYAPELWTYGGVAPGSKFAKVAVWYDENRERYAYQAKGTGRLAVGCQYELSVNAVTGASGVTAPGRPPAAPGRAGGPGPATRPAPTRRGSPP